MKKLTLNYHHLHRFRISPKHYEYYLTDKEAQELDRKQDVFYSALIAFLSDEELFHKNYIVLEDKFLPFKHKERDKFKKDFVAGYPDRIVIEQYYYDLLLEIGIQANKCKTLRLQLEKGESGITHSIGDEKTNMTLECTPAWIPADSTLIGFHLCERASNNIFEKVIFNMGCYTRAAWDLNILHKEGKLPIPKTAFLLFALENKAPFICETYRIPNEAIRAGMRENRMLIDLLYWCNRTGFFPNYSEFNLAKDLYKEGELHDKDVDTVFYTLDSFEKMNPGYHEVATPAWL